MPARHGANPPSRASNTLARQPQRLRQGATNGLVPTGEKLPAALLRHLGREARLILEKARELVPVGPEARRKAREKRGAEGGALGRLATHHVNAEKIRLELHDEGVVGRSPIDLERGQGMAGIRLHGLEDVVGLIGHGLARRAHETHLVRTTRDARYDTASVGPPPGRAKARERRHDVAAVRVRHGARERGRLLRAIDEAQAVA